MTRPVWEEATARAIAGQLVWESVPPREAVGIAAVITRALDRRYDLTAGLLSAEIDPYDIPADIAEKTGSANYRRMVSSFWNPILKASKVGRKQRSLFRTLAGSLYLTTPKVEAEAVRQIAAAIAADVAGMVALSGLRNDLETTGSAGAVSAYDELAGSGSEADLALKTYLKKYQSWAKAAGRYAGTVDGRWGAKSETSFVGIVPGATGRVTRLSDLAAVNAVSGLELHYLIGAAILRDRWLNGQGIFDAADGGWGSDGAGGDSATDDPTRVTVDTSALDAERARREAEARGSVTVTETEQEVSDARERHVADASTKKSSLGLWIGGILLVGGGVTAVVAAVRRAQKGSKRRKTRR